MNIQRIQVLLAEASIPEVKEETKLSLRTLFRIKAGKANITLSTLEALEKWAKGRRIKGEKS